MELYWKGAAGIILAAILGITVSRREKDMTVVLHSAVCVMAAIIALQYLSPVLEFLQELDSRGSFPEGVMGLLMRAMGIGIFSQIAGSLCADSGSASLSRCISFLSGAVILYLSLPMFYSLMDILQDILGEA